MGYLRLQCQLRRWGKTICSKIELFIVKHTARRSKGLRSDTWFLWYRRSHVPDPSENCNCDENLLGECGSVTQTRRHPFAVLAQNSHNAGNKLSTQQQVNDIKEIAIDGKIDALVYRCHYITHLYLKKVEDKRERMSENCVLLTLNSIIENWL